MQGAFQEREGNFWHNAMNHPTRHTKVACNELSSRNLFPREARDDHEGT